MATVKTSFTQEGVDAYLLTVDDLQKRADSYRLIELMQSVTGVQAQMFGSSIVGFGQYHYVYASGHSGDAPILGFSPRKAAISLYVYTGLPAHAALLEGLGKFKMGKACIYIKRLSDIDEAVLIQLMTHTLQFISAEYDRIR